MEKNKYINKISKADLMDYIIMCGLKMDKAFNMAVQTISYYRSSDREATRELQEMEVAWYKSLDKSKPNYTIYGLPYYMVDVWACWVVYSRGYLKLISSLNIKGIKSVADIGCGFGYTTATLKEMFPKASVVGTNIKNTIQFEISSKIGESVGFKVVPLLPHKHIDLIFASEYFEHIYKPIEHLEQLLAQCTPNHLIFANAFNTISIGHFREYLHLSKMYPAKNMQKMFLKTLKIYGYNKVHTGFWNSRPNYYRL